MNTADVISTASAQLRSLSGHVFDVLTVAKPVSPEAALNLSKVVSKLSPLVGNMIEFNTCEYLNEQEEFKELGKWRRQDPGFPDVVFDGSVKPTPGFEVKAWFPLATEITARFKDSQNHFLDDRTHVAMIAWLPEFVADRSGTWSGCIHFLSTASSNTRCKAALWLLIVDCVSIRPAF